MNKGFFRGFAYATLLNTIIIQIGFVIIKLSGSPVSWFLVFIPSWGITAAFVLLIVSMVAYSILKLSREE